MASVNSETGGTGGGTGGWEGTASGINGGRSGGLGGTGRGGAWDGYDFNTTNNIGRAKGSVADGNWGGRNAGSNHAYAVDPMTGSLVQVGAPSRMGGMMQTAAGGRLGGYAAGIGGIGSLDWSKRNMSNQASPYYDKYYSNVQKNIKADAYSRQKEFDKAFSGIFNKPNMSWDEKKRDLDALNKGLVSELEQRGYDMSGVKSTHRSGGLMGMIGDFFGAKKEDVDTMREVQENTPAWGYGPLGFGLGMMAGPIAQKVGEVTESYPAAMAAKKGVGWAASRMSPPTPSFAKHATRALGLAGVPAMGQVAQMAAMANQARDLNYAGVTNPHGPAPAYEGYGGGGMMNSAPVMTAKVEQADGGHPDLAAQWQRMWATPFQWEA